MWGEEGVLCFRVHPFMCILMEHCMHTWREHVCAYRWLCMCKHGGNTSTYSWSFACTLREYVCMCIFMELGMHRNAFIHTNHKKRCWIHNHIIHPPPERVYVPVFSVCMRGLLPPKNKSKTGPQTWV